MEEETIFDCKRKATGILAKEWLKILHSSMPITEVRLRLQAPYHQGLNRMLIGRRLQTQ